MGDESDRRGQQVSDAEEGELLEEGEAPEAPVKEQKGNSWLFTAEEMATDRPSLRDGMSLAAEESTRVKGVLLIQNLGIMLRMFVLFPVASLHSPV